MMSKEYMFILYSTITGIYIRYSECPFNRLGFGYSISYKARNQKMFKAKRLIFSKIIN